MRICRVLWTLKLISEGMRDISLGSTDELCYMWWLAVFHHGGTWINKYYYWWAGNLNFSEFTVV